MEQNLRFEDALYGVSVNIRNILLRLPQTVKNNTEEIRLRVNKPVALTVAGDTVLQPYRILLKALNCYAEIQFTHTQTS